MNRSRVPGQLLLITCLLMMALSAFAQAQRESSTYEPQVGQDGKDVIWVPSALALVNKMLDMAGVTSEDYLIDLGSGDGRTVITAAKRGAPGLGIEFNPDLVALSNRNAAREGVSARAQFIQADIFESDFAQATVITMFLLPDINLKLRPRILDLKPGTRILSNSFDMADWQADQITAVGPEQGCYDAYCQAYLWIVPAKVAGLWKITRGRLELRQNFQMISGSIRTGAKRRVIKNGKLKGNQISFSVGDDQYSGRVDGKIMQGSVRNQRGSVNWEASRTD